MKSKTEIFKELTEQAASTYKWKNHDYGDSFAKTRALIPNAILVRLHDKLNRLTTLMLSDQQMVKTESIEDTLLDMANYCLMELTERVYDKREVVLHHGCDYNRKGFCIAQKGMPQCDSDPVVCDIAKCE